MRADQWPQGHAATNFSRWSSVTTEYAITPPENFEPYVLLSMPVPLYDQRLTGFGWVFNFHFTNQLSISRLPCQKVSSHSLDFSLPSEQYVQPNSRLLPPFYQNKVSYTHELRHTHKFLVAAQVTLASREIFPLFCSPASKGFPSFVHLRRRFSYSHFKMSKTSILPLPLPKEFISFLANLNHDCERHLWCIMRMHRPSVRSPYLFMHPSPVSRLCTVHRHVRSP